MDFRIVNRSPRPTVDANGPPEVTIRQLDHRWSHPRMQPAALVRFSFTQLASDSSDEVSAF